MQSAAVRLRLHDSAGLPGPRTAFVPIDLDKTQLRHSIDADVSVFIGPSFMPLPVGVDFHCINARELATQETLATRLSMADLVTFIGFPRGPDKVPWFDTAAHLPIGRLAGLASRPDTPFTNPQIPTADVTLVSGLSFRGSSGSPVVSHIKHAAGIGHAQQFAEPMVLGIMSGHWWDEQIEPSLFHHSGLSYFTRATSIRALLVGVP